MAKLNQINAVVAGKKARTVAALTDVYHRLQKSALFDGISRTYEPGDENGEMFPPEKKTVQFKVRDAIAEVKVLLADMYDVVATQDAANQKATAEVAVDGTVVLSNVPVTTLLFLEKQLVDVRTFITKIPLLDPSETWIWSDSVGAFVSEAVKTAKSKKIPRNHVKAEATDKHPAQVELYYEDTKVGEWKTIKFSGAIGAVERDAMLKRVEKLQEAVKMAREKANSIDAEDCRIGEQVLGFVFGK